MPNNTDRLVWIDCEMTGLDVGIDELVEVAVVITDFDLNILDPGFDIVIKPGQAAMGNMGDFVRAMHEGIGKGGERLYPAFPYVEFTRVAGRDVLAIRAYLNTVAPVHYTAPANALRFPFNQRWLMILWNLFNFDESRFVPDPKQSAEFNRGAYLVEGLAHCEECHTPRNFMQGLRTTERFSGATQAGDWACTAEVASSNASATRLPLFRSC